jgi:hypothetical protein
MILFPYKALVTSLQASQALQIRPVGIAAASQFVIRILKIQAIFI